MQLSVPAQLNSADGFVSRPAREHPERIAILGEPRPFTYREVEEAVNRAAKLARSGKKVMQFLSEARYVANVMDGKVTLYGGANDG